MLISTSYTTDANGLAGGSNKEVMLSDRRFHLLGLTKRVKLVEPSPLVGAKSGVKPDIFFKPARLVNPFHCEPKECHLGLFAPAPQSSSVG